jgi:two-component system cell cycle sensor histidine kinase/response regulator CckA
MTDKANRPDGVGPPTDPPGESDAQALRRKAEAMARGYGVPTGADAMTPEQLGQTLHDLYVHQIELELQNEELRRTQMELDASRARFFDLYDLAPVGYCTLSEHGVILEANLTAATLLGMPRGALVRQAISRFIIQEDQSVYYHHRKHLSETGEPQSCDLRMIRPDGTGFWAHLAATAARPADSTSPTVDRHSPPACRVVLSDISARKRMEEELRARETQYRALFDDAPIGYHETDAEGRVNRVNRTELAMLGYDEDQMLGRHVWEFVQEQEVAKKAVIEKLAGRLAAGEELERTYLRKDGTCVPVLIQSRMLLDGDGRITGLRTTSQSIAEHKRAEAERARLEEQLQQAQKMESVGRLAGGVAHDFNNMLGVILGHAELALDQVKPSDPLHVDLSEIHKAAARSADLTRQLLAFARRQTVAPVMLDLNETVAGMLTMLRRLIGEDIDLRFHPEPGLWNVRVDPSQIDQILANLCVNSRDAISGIGTMTIRLANRTLDQSYCAAHPGAAAGEFVLLSLSDDGCGMAQDVLSHLFEPFFTTKAMGRGTGLGLATVYGIVKQNRGCIDVRSEPTHGTTFSIYLPRFEPRAGLAGKPGSAALAPGGHETILLVEDEPAILTLTRRVLERCGYTVLAAAGPAEALRLAMAHPGEIHLLVTDVIMPEMNGRALARNLLSLYPRLARLFMSGYTADVIAQDGAPEEGMHFIQKPFSTDALAAAVRLALDSRK